MSKRNPKKIRRTQATQPATSLHDLFPTLADNTPLIKRDYLNIRSATESVSNLNISKTGGGLSQVYAGKIVTNSDDVIPSQNTTIGSEEKTSSSNVKITSSEDEAIEDKDKSTQPTMTWASFAHHLTAENRIGVPALLVVYVVFIMIVIGYTFIQDNGNHSLDTASGLFYCIGKILCQVIFLSSPWWLFVLFNKRLSTRQKTKLSIIFLICIITFGIFGLLLLLKNNISKTEQPQSTKPATTNNSQPAQPITTNNNQAGGDGS